MFGSREHRDTLQPHSAAPPRHQWCRKDPEDGLLTAILRDDHAFGRIDELHSVDGVPTTSYRCYGEVRNAGKCNWW